MPAASGMPVTLWTTPKQTLQWVRDGDKITSSWRTPVFDLRADLRSGQGGAKFGVPIWKSGHLYLQVYGLAANRVLDNLKVLATEFASVNFANVYQAQPNQAVANAGMPNQVTSNNIIRVTAPVDVTSEFMLGINQPDSIILTFAPLGEGYPIRYWSLNLDFSKLVQDGIINPLVSVEAAYY